MLRRAVEIGLAIAAVALPAVADARCGQERWPVKIGSDGDAASVNTTTATPTTIDAFRAWPAPDTLPPTNRIAPYELAEWSVDATLVRFKFEDSPTSGGSDYHLVLANPSGATIIAEIPSPACVSPQSPFLGAISQARVTFDQRFTALGRFQMANITVRVVGVGFFDFHHGQSGVAPNAVELHPVLKITFNPPGFNP